MQRTVWLLVGLLLGAGSMWGYTTQIREPQLIAQTTQEVKEVVEADRIASSNEIRGSVVRIIENANLQTGFDTHTLIVKNASSGAEVSVMTDAKTMFYRLAVESNDGRHQINALALKAGEELMIITNPSANENTLYATEVVAY